MCTNKWPSWLTPLLLITLTTEQVFSADDYNILNPDGSYVFGYNNRESYHYSRASPSNVVVGEFGAKNPATGLKDRTTYTAGPRGFRPQGDNIVRKYDRNQSPVRPIGSRDDPYFDPNEDPSYEFEFNTATHNRAEVNDRGKVRGRYSYYDDVGERHNVDYIAGKDTGFVVKSPYPDSPRSFGPLYRPRRPFPRGRISIKNENDGRYSFVSAGPDQRRSETRDLNGDVRGSYTYLDDKGLRHTVHYIAGPKTGYIVLKNVKGPHLPDVFPFGVPETYPSNLYGSSDTNNEVFDTAGSSHIKPGNKGDSNKDKDSSSGNGFDKNDDKLDDFETRPLDDGATNRPIGGISSRPDSDSGSESRPQGGSARPEAGTFNKPFNFDEIPRPIGGLIKPNFDDFIPDTEDVDLFGETTKRPSVGSVTQTSSTSNGGAYKPTSQDDGSYKPTSHDDDGSYKPDSSKEDDGVYKPFQDTNKPTGGFSNNPSGSQTTNIPIRPNKPVKPSYDDENLGQFGNKPFGSKPISVFPSRPSKPVKPSYDDEDELNGNGSVNLFEDASDSIRPPRPIRPPHQSDVQIAISHEHEADKSDKSPCRLCKSRTTVVKNVGKEVFTVNAGASVRAHVQAIDLLPYNPTGLSPSDQLKIDSSVIEEQLNSDASNISNSTLIVAKNSTEV